MIDNEMEMIPREKSRCRISAKPQEKGYGMRQLNIMSIVTVMGRKKQM